MESRTPQYVLLGVGALFLFGFAANVVTGELTAADTAIQLSIAAICGTTFWFLRSEARRRAELLEYIAGHVDDIRAGTASWGGETLTYATRLRTYQFVMSFLLVSVKLPTRMFVVGGPHRNRGVRAACAAVTLVLGWWGIPWGPVWTIQALVGNERARDITLGEMIEGKTDVAVPAARVRSR